MLANEIGHSYDRSNFRIYHSSSRLFTSYVRKPFVYDLTSYSRSFNALVNSLVDHFRRVRSHFRARQNTTRFQPSISPWFTPSVLNVSPFLRLSPHSLIVKSVLRAFTSRSKSLGLLRQKEFRSLALVSHSRSILEKPWFALLGFKRLSSHFRGRALETFALAIALALAFSLLLSLPPFTD